MSFEIWVNPACSKCRTAVSALDDAGADYTIRRYLDEPPTVAELEDVLARLGLEPWDITRTADAGKLGLSLPAKDEEHRHEWLELMVDNPKLIQRPIITADDGTTVVARDPETLAKILQK
jgi:arsenate reductase